MSDLKESLTGGKHGVRLAESEVARLPVDKRERGCTDALCCVTFIVFWAAMFFMAGTVIQQSGGKNGYLRLVNGQMYNGEVCGVDSQAGKKFLYWVEPIKQPDITLCVDACPTDATAGYARVNTTDGKVLTWSSYKTVPSFHYCFPAAVAGPARAAVQDALDARGVSHAMSDLGRSWQVLLGAAFIALCAGFLYLLILRHTAGVLIYVIIVLILIGLGAGGYLLFSHSQTMADGAQGKQATMWVGIGLWAVDAIFLLLVCGLRKSIRIAVACLEEATKVVRDQKSMLFIPPIKFFLALLLFVYWVAVAVYMASASTTAHTISGVKGAAGLIGDVEVHSITVNKSLGEAFAFHFFGLLWGIAFIIAVGDMILAHATAQWYFHPAVDGVKNVDGPVARAVSVTVMRHMGTAAFGSLILAIVGFIKWFMRYVTSKLKDKTGDTALLRFALCCCNCCIACFERIVKFVGRQAYIQTALFGTPFCSSTKQAFELFARNAGKLASTTMVGGIFMMMGKLFVTAVTAVSTYFLVQKYFSGPDGVSSPVLPTVVAGCIGYVVGAVFTQVFDMAINTILHCFVADIDAHPRGAQFASPKLRDIALKR